MQRRTFLAGALFQAQGAAELIGDARFERGMKVWLPAPGKKVEAGVLRGAGAEAAGQPVWGLAQWHSRFDLSGTRREALPSGAARYFDGAKAVVFGAGGGGPDLVLELNGRTEYSERAPEKGAAWPHLLVEQELRSHPAMDRLEAAEFHIEYRLERAEVHRLPGWDAQRHTAQFLFYTTIQNRNRASRGFGDYLWFGVPMYDARYPLPRRHAAMDRSTPQKQGTGKFIFNPGGERYNPKPLRIGEWARIECDLLPLMREAMETAWTAGFLADSRDARDYQLAGMNLGWEVTGPLDVSMAVRGFGLRAQSRP
jgi:hypothetical protein